MLEPALALAAALAALVLVHLRLRKQFSETKADFQRELQSMEAAHRQLSVHFKAQQDAIFDSMTEGLVLLDESNRIVLANRSFVQLFGITTDIRSRMMIEAVRLHELTELVDLLDRESQVLDRELKFSNPTERWVQVNGAAILDSGGARRGAILVFHDLTRLKKLENVRKEFVANVSHELRTPLSLIKGYAETLLDGAKDDPEVSTRFLQTIERNADRLKLLIEDLLTISELESGRLEMDFHSVALRPIAQKVLDDLQPRALGRQATLVNNAAELNVHADGTRLEQVLGNLVDNAIKYGRTGGKVQVSARATAGNQVEVSVQDDGPGIPAEALERVFERFYRVDKARSREQGGTGLGLSIVKHIVLTHGGKVWATSEPGSGTTFYFTVPAAKVTEQ